MKNFLRSGSNKKIIPEMSPAKYARINKYNESMGSLIVIEPPSNTPIGLAMCLKHRNLIRDAFTTNIKMINSSGSYNKKA
jgi:hypothetical protein